MKFFYTEPQDQITQQHSAKTNSQKQSKTAFGFSLNLKIIVSVKHKASRNTT